ncbi:hypothetical protein B2M23_14700 [Eubacterium limosum]|uniref:Uncharacterized protein n=1 Tax=Eubacterium limosum TaxID=1736 RepID=A0AAC9QWD6_EUBLI|nr:hypothetical protein B2M23_14700 [Eubacterium limosum]
MSSKNKRAKSETGANLRWSFAVKKWRSPETAPFIQIRKSVQALWITAKNQAALLRQPDISEISYKF